MQMSSFFIGLIVGLVLAPVVGAILLKFLGPIYMRKKFEKMFNPVQNIQDN